MSRSAVIEMPWADGAHTFRLAFEQLVELQEKTDAGPLFLLNRLLSGSWRVGDVVETIRLGLIGGGVKPVDALKLVERYAKREGEWLENAQLARAILGAALLGVEDDPTGEPPAPDQGPGQAPDSDPGPAGDAKPKGRRKSRSKTASGGSRGSTARRSSSAFPPATSTP